jgi:4-hydroxy-3-methylbut-2-enyl diphosphate reductase
MKIYLAEHAGFCFGVRRAIDMALNSTKGEDGKIYTIGPIIHNPQMVKKLEDKGVYVVKHIDELASGSTVILRSHGVTHETLKTLKERGMKIIDATCPFVTRAQQRAAELAEDGYKVVVVGEKNHPEVIGIVSFTHNEAVVFNHDEENREEIIVEITQSQKVGVVAQTTIRTEYLDDLVCQVLPNVKEIRVFNTICSTTLDRQESTKKLAKKVDAMVVVGGYNSANTNRLASICRELDKPTFHIEKAEELDLENFKDYDEIGITAGASTPDWIIEDVIKTLDFGNEKER